MGQKEPLYSFRYEYKDLEPQTHYHKPKRRRAKSANPSRTHPAQSSPHPRSANAPATPPIPRALLLRHYSPLW